MRKAQCTAQKSIKHPSNLIRPENEEIMKAFILGCRQDFLTFASACFELLTGEPLPRRFYVEAMAYELDQIWRRKNRRLMINLPPRSFKSFLASVAWPAYLLGLNPRLRIMVASGNTDLATDLSNAFRRILTSELQTGVSRNAHFGRKEYRIGSVHQRWWVQVDRHYGGRDWPGSRRADL
jgi:hypothetical protein